MKFSVGDKVRVVNTTHSTGSLGNGIEGVIEAFDDGKRLVRIRITKGRYDDLWVGDTAHYVVDELELVAPVAPRFKVGDRVKVVAPYYKDGVWGKHVGVVFDVWDDAAHVSVRFDENDPDWRDGEFRISELAPAPRHVFAASQASHIDDETIDRWVDEGVKNVEAQKTLNFENPSFTTKSGDALVVVENGKAYLYRLEGELDVE